MNFRLDDINSKISEKKIEPAHPSMAKTKDKILSQLLIIIQIMQSYHGHCDSEGKRSDNEHRVFVDK